MTIPDVDQGVPYVLLTGGEDGTALEMAFSRKKIEERKAWLRGFVPGTYLDHTASAISYTDFVNKASNSDHFLCHSELAGCCVT